MAGSAKSPTSGRVRGERLEARTTVDQKRLIEHAAALQSRSMTDFELSSLQDAARRHIDEYQRLELSIQDSQTFVQALIEPQPVNERLSDTVRRYRERTGV